MNLKKVFGTVALTFSVCTSASASTIALIDGTTGNSLSNATVVANSLEPSTIYSVTGASINSQTAASLYSKYDALIFAWSGSSYSAGFWNVLKGYVNLGGGVIFDGASSATSALTGSGITFSAGNFSGPQTVTNHTFTTESFVQADNSHLGTLIGNSDWTTFLKNGGSSVSGLFASFGAGNIIVTSTDYFYHSDTAAERAFLTDEVRYATTSVPEPTTVALLGLGLLGFAASHRKSAKSKNA